MRLLVLDHFFEHDISSLRAAAPAGVELRSMSYGVLRNEALDVFPRQVIDDTPAYAQPDWEPRRREMARRTVRVLEDEHSRAPFDAFVVPSDLFFYVREAPAACHALGVPFVVVQKETLITPYIENDHSAEIGAHLPPIGDVMTVCSERHRQFWLRVGADPERVLVTGQPRFDAYAGPPRRRAPDEAPRLLFLSYHMGGGYYPSDGGQPVWRTLHDETLERVLELARRGWDVTIKPHPQQDFTREREAIGAVERVRVADGAEDVRGLIVGCDVVLGFQSTALIEAMAARKPIVYTGWSPVEDEVAQYLMPFREWDDVLSIVRAPGDLVGAVDAALKRGTEGLDLARRRAIVEEHLGPVDGHASERTLAIVADEVERFQAARTPAIEARRAALAARRPPLRLARRARHFLIAKRDARAVRQAMRTSTP